MKRPQPTNNLQCVTSKKNEDLKRTSKEFHPNKYPVEFQEWIQTKLFRTERKMFHDLHFADVHSVQ